MTRALVTGSEGFLGRHFTLALLQQGYQVAGVDIAALNPVNALTLFADPTPTTRFDLVVHCAARSPHRAAIDGEPVAVGSANLQLDAALFGWALLADPSHLLYISSSAVYPVGLQDGSVNVPLCEEWVSTSDSSVGMPDAVYGWTKLTGEVLAERYRATGRRITVVRPFSGYGSDQSGLFPFGAFRDRASARMDPFRVWGGGRQVRDFIHVDDLVAGALAAVASGVAGPVNLCTGVGTSMIELADLFTRHAGYSPSIQLVGDAPEGVNYRVGNPDRLNEFYRPKIDIERGVALALEGWS